MQNSLPFYFVKKGKEKIIMKYNVDSKFEDSCILTKRNHPSRKERNPRFQTRRLLQRPVQLWWGSLTVQCASTVAECTLWRWAQDTGPFSSTQASNTWHSRPGTRPLCRSFQLSFILRCHSRSLRPAVWRVKEMTSRSVLKCTVLTVSVPPSTAVMSYITGCLGSGTRWKLAPLSPRSFSVCCWAACALGSSPPSWSLSPLWVIVW